VLGSEEAVGGHENAEDDEAQPDDGDEDCGADGDQLAHAGT